MKKHIFYHKYANVPLGDRLILLSNAANDILQGKTLMSVYAEIKEIDNKLRSDEIRREKLLGAVRPHLEKVTMSKDKLSM